MATPEELNETLNQLKEGLLQLAEAVKTAADAETDAEKTAREIREREKANEKKDLNDAENIRRRQRIADEAAINEELKNFGLRKKSSGETEKLENQRSDILKAVNKALTESAGVFHGLTDAALENMKNQVKQQAVVDNQVEQIKRQIESSVAFTAAQADTVRTSNMALKQKQREIEASKNLGSVILRQKENFNDLLGKAELERDSIVALTADQYKQISAIEQETAARNKQIDEIKNAGRNLVSMVGNIKDVSSALAAMKQKQLAALASDDTTGAAKIIGKFTLLGIGVGLATNAFDLLVAGMKGYYEGILATQRALYAGERGAAVEQAKTIAMYKAMAAQAKSSSDSLLNLGKEAAFAGFAIASIIPGGWLLKGAMAAAGLAVGGLTAAMGAAEKIAGELAERQAEVLEMYVEQTKILFGAFNELGKASMIGAEGMTGLYNNLHKVGLTVKEFDKFNKVLQTNAKDMKMFGTTASEGVNKFVKVASGLVNSELGHTFRLMGLSNEEMMDHQAKYMAQQARFGMLQNKSTEQLIKGTSDYIIELDKTAALTGASRKDQEESMKFIMANEKLRAGMLVEEEKAKKTGDYTILKEMQQAANLAAKLNEAGLKRAATGAAEYYGAGKTITGNESAEFYSTFGKTIKDINEGRKSDTVLFLQGTKEAYEGARRVADSRRYGANTEGLYGDTTQSAVDARKRTETIERTAKERGISVDTPEFEKLVKELGETRITKDPETIKQVKLLEESMKAATKQDDAVKNKSLSAILGDSLIKPVGMMEKAGTAMLDAGKSIFDAGKTMLEAGNKMLKSVMGEVKSQPDTTNQLKLAKETLLIKHKKEKLEEMDKYDKEVSAGLRRMSASERESKLLALDKKFQKELEKLEKEILQGPSSSSASPTASATSGAKPSAPGGASMLAGGSTLSSSNEQLKDAGLRIKSGDVQAPGSKIDPKLLEIAKQVQANIPGFNYFSGFNDQYHQENASSSQHTKGLAFDFTVNPGRGKSKPSKEDSENIIKMLKDMGIDSVINEYDNPSAKATGGHFHAELNMPGAYDGGLFDGPKAGYPVELHGREAIVPLPDPSSKISVETPAAAGKNSLNSVLSNDISTSTSNMSSKILENLYDLMEMKFDELITASRESNDISDKLLKYSQV